MKVLITINDFQTYPWIDFLLQKRHHPGWIIGGHREDSRIMLFAQETLSAFKPDITNENATVVASWSLYVIHRCCKTRHHLVCWSVGCSLVLVFNWIFHSSLLFKTDVYRFRMICLPYQTEFRWSRVSPAPDRPHWAIWKKVSAWVVRFHFA